MNQISIEKLQSLDPRDFENLVRTLFAKMGFNATTTKPSGDGGIDVIAINEQPIVGGKYVIQCKRYITGNNVGEPVIRDLFGVMHAENANKGIVVTTSDFTNQAIMFAQGKAVELISGAALINLLNQYTLEDASTHKTDMHLFDIEKGFGDLAWGSRREDYKGLIETEWTSYYRKLNDITRYGGVSIDPPLYQFSVAQANRLVRITISFKQWRNFEAMLGFLMSKYGEPNDDLFNLASNDRDYKWNINGRVEMWLAYRAEQDETGFLWFSYLPLWNALSSAAVSVSTEKKQCFVATVIYGSSDAREVIELRKWRDDYIMNYWIGRVSIRCYYAVGPSLANFVNKRSYLKKVFKVFLNIFVRVLQ